jgi:hypothetical protein
MKIRFALMIMFMLMLLPLRLEAKSVNVALVSGSQMEQGVPNLDALDQIIQSNLLNLDDYFTKNDDLTLQLNQELVIRGGRGSIRTKLDPYPAKKVILNARGKNYAPLEAYGCYVKRGLGTDNPTYVLVTSAYKMRTPPGAPPWKQWGKKDYCAKEFVTFVTDAPTQVITLKQLSNAILKNLPK